jgi:hypothetical protein
VTFEKVQRIALDVAVGKYAAIENQGFGFFVSPGD